MNKNKGFKLQRDSMIVAMVIVSESELLEYQSDFFKDITPEKFSQSLYQLGIDVSKGVVQQKGLIHRNRLNQVVRCTRWLGEERQDSDWIYSGYASQAALDKYSGNRLLEDLYRSKALTVDTQAALEERDKFDKINEAEWI